MENSIVALAVAAGLAFIPAIIAKSKGYSFVLWWFYGWMLFIVAIIHVSCIPDKNAKQTPIYQNNSIPYCPPSNAEQSAADELIKYKELFDQGAITEQEFQAKKESLLKCCYEEKQSKTSTVEKRDFSVIAAATYAGIAVVTIIDSISYGPITVFNIIYCIALIGLAVALFMKKKKAVAFSAGVPALLNVYYLVTSFSLETLFYFLAHVAFIVIIILAIKGNAAAKKIWFLAVTLQFVGSMINLINMIHYDILYYPIQLLMGIGEIAALLFAGMWIKDDMSIVADAPVNENAVFNPQGYNSEASLQCVIGGADKLKSYKKLLDSGIITQEEFDAKKKQILGL